MPHDLDRAVEYHEEREVAIALGEQHLPRAYRARMAPCSERGYLEAISPWQVLS